MIRKAILADADTIARQNVAMAAESEDYALDFATTFKGVQHILQHEALGTYYILEVDGACACRLLITYEYSDWRNRMMWWIQSVYTEPVHRGKGLYRQLYAHVLEEAKAQDIASVRLYYAVENTVADKTYRALGMEVDHYRVGQQDLP